MAHDVFISYSTRNKPVADAVCAGLESNGIRCWVAPRDILPGQTWAGAIIDAIDVCKVFVLVVSADSISSDDVLREVQNAASNELPIIPFRIDDAPLSQDMRYYLGVPHWLDALTPPLEAHIERLCSTVGLLLGREADAPRTPSTPAPVATAPPAAEHPAPPKTDPKPAQVAAVVDQPAPVTPPLTVPGDKAWEKPGKQVGDEIIGPDGGTYVWMPPGEFMMGSDDGSGNEKPVHRVRIARGVWLGKHEVTNARYRAFCDASGRTFPPGSYQGNDHPVVYVSWDDATAYCEHYKLTLPTEAQWEYGARGPEANVYPWGTEWDAKKCCNYGNKGPGGNTFPVGSFADGASWCGALDMAGNVYEWCADWFGEDYYAESPEADPTGPASGEFRVLRGGSLLCTGPESFRCAYRDVVNPSARSDLIGFRCSRGPTS